MSFRRANLNLSSVYGPSLDISQLKRTAQEKVKTELARATNLNNLISVMPLADKKIQKTVVKKDEQVFNQVSSPFGEDQTSKINSPDTTQGPGDDFSYKMAKAMSEPIGQKRSPPKQHIKLKKAETMGLHGIDMRAQSGTFQNQK